MKRKIIIILCSSVLILTGIFIGMKFSENNNQEKFLSQERNENKGMFSKNISNNGNEEQENCQDKIIFTHEFTDLNLINHLGVIGAINAGSSGRSYVAVKKSANGTYPFVPVYAPVNSTIVGITYARRGGPNTAGEYRLDIKAGCGIEYFFDHIDDVSDKIKELAPKEPADNTRTGAYVSLPIETGELLGYTDGTPQAHTWDFSVMNMNKENYFINPSRWEWAQNKNAICPYDLFVDEIKNRYYEALALWDGSKQEIPNCGKASHDVPGTLAGGWFQGNAKDTQGNRLVLGGLYSLVELIIDRDSGPRFSIRDYNFKKMPEEITIGNEICYSDGNNFAYLKLLSDNKMITSIGNGNCPNSFPNKENEEWER